MQGNAFKAPHRTLYALALAAEIGLLYYGFSFLLLGYMSQKDRWVGTMVFFPLAALAAGWGGWLSIRILPPECRTKTKIIKQHLYWSSLVFVQ